MVTLLLHRNITLRHVYLHSKSIIVSNNTCTILAKPVSIHVSKRFTGHKGKLPQEVSKIIPPIVPTSIVPPVNPANSTTTQVPSNIPLTSSNNPGTNLYTNEASLWNRLGNLVRPVKTGENLPIPSSNSSIRSQNNYQNARPNQGTPLARYFRNNNRINNQASHDVPTTVNNSCTALILYDPKTDPSIPFPIRVRTNILPSNDHIFYADNTGTCFTTPHIIPQNVPTNINSNNHASITPVVSSPSSSDDISDSPLMDIVSPAIGVVSSLGLPSSIQVMNINAISLSSNNNTTSSSINITNQDTTLNADFPSTSHSIKETIRIKNHLGIEVDHVIVSTNGKKILFEYIAIKDEKGHLTGERFLRAVIPENMAPPKKPKLSSLSDDNNTTIFVNEKRDKKVKMFNIPEIPQIKDPVTGNMRSMTLNEEIEFIFKDFKLRLENPQENNPINFSEIMNKISKNSTSTQRIQHTDHFRALHSKLEERNRLLMQELYGFNPIMNKILEDINKEALSSTRHEKYKILYSLYQKVITDAIHPEVSKYSLSYLNILSVLKIYVEENPQYISLIEKVFLQQTFNNLMTPEALQIEISNIKDRITLLQEILQSSVIYLLPQQIIIEIIYKVNLLKYNDVTFQMEIPSIKSEGPAYITKELKEHGGAYLTRTGFTIIQNNYDVFLTKEAVPLSESQKKEISIKIDTGDFKVCNFINDPLSTSILESGEELHLNIVVEISDSSNVESKRLIGTAYFTSAQPILGDPKNRVVTLDNKQIHYIIDDLTGTFVKHIVNKDQNIRGSNYMVEFYSKEVAVNYSMTRVLQEDPILQQNLINALGIFKQEFLSNSIRQRMALNNERLLRLALSSEMSLLTLRQMELQKIHHEFKNSTEKTIKREYDKRQKTVDIALKDSANAKAKKRLPPSFQDLLMRKEDAEKYDKNNTKGPLNSHDSTKK